MMNGFRKQVSRIMVLVLVVAGGAGFACNNRFAQQSPKKMDNSVTTPIHKEQQENIIAEGASLQLVSNQFSFTEGPAADQNGNIYFTDQPNNQIWKYDVEGKLTLFMDKAGRSNGLFVDKEGSIIACADEKNELWKITKDGKVSVLVQDFEGKKLNGPNDVWVHPSGLIYFTDPYYQRDYWERKEKELEQEGVYLLTGKNEVTLVDQSLKKPNGIIGTPDGRFLYVADIGANKTYRFAIDKTGKLLEKKLFAEQGSDGMTLDNRGNLYLTGNGVTVYSPDGKKLTHIPVPARWTANVCFGGKNQNLLFITASEAVYTLQMNVKRADL